MTAAKMPELYPRAWEIRWPSKEDGFEDVKYHGTNAIADYRDHVHPEAKSRELVCKDEAVESMRAYGQACWDAARVVDEGMVMRAAYLISGNSPFPSARSINKARAALQAALGGGGE